MCQDSGNTPEGTRDLLAEQAPQQSSPHGHQEITGFLRQSGRGNNLGKEPSQEALHTGVFHSVDVPNLVEEKH